jgi:uncharacterized membrane protein YgdD (TMEM256/DUF423 family)
MSRTFVMLGSINAFLAVALGAFGAHVLKTAFDAKAMQTWQTAVEYHFYHALGLLVIALLAEKLPRTQIPGWIMFAGLVLFSGSLYLLCLTGIKGLGMITPVGGVSFLIAWGWLAVLAYRSAKN